MSRDRMPFHVGDYLRDTMHLNAMQHGMYLKLIFHYWIHGGLPKTTAAKSRVAGVPDQTFRDNEITLAGFFLHPGWRHKRLDADLAEYEKIKENKKVVGAIGGTKAQINRHLRAVPGAQVPNHGSRENGVANGVPIRKKDRDLSSSSETEPREEEKKRVAEKARGASLQASAMLEAIVRKKGWT